MGNERKDRQVKTLAGDPEPFMLWPGIFLWLTPGEIAYDFHQGYEQKHVGYKSSPYGTRHGLPIWGNGDPLPVLEVIFCADIQVIREGNGPWLPLRGENMHPRSPARLEVEETVMGTSYHIRWTLR
jgi:hypothetical protein